MLVKQQSKDVVRIPVNWQEILSELGYKLLHHGNEFRTSAVWRNGDNPTSVVINPETGTFYDFGDKKGGTISKLIALTQGIEESEVNEAFQYIEKKPTVSFTEALNIPRTYSDECLKRLIKDYSYFESRGISKETQMIFEAGFVNRESFAGRMVFPIRSMNDRIIGFSGRYTKPIHDKKFPKWLIKGPKRFFVYNHKIALPAIKEEQCVILVESIGDVLSLYEAGIKNALCLFGLNMSPAILKYLITLNCKVIISTNRDGEAKDSHGENSAKDIKNKLLKYFLPEKVAIHLPEKGDWNEILMDKGWKYLKDWYEKTCKNEQNVVEYKEFTEYYS